MSLRLSTVILPYRRWHEGGRSAWQRAEQLGFHTAYTYDHLSWRSFRDGPRFGAVPTLTAAGRWSRWMGWWTSRDGTGNWASPRSCSTGPYPTPTSPPTRRSSSR